MRMGVIYYPNPILEGVSHPVNLDSIGEEAFRLLTDNMIETAKDYRAEGLAAVQVGFPMRMFVMRTDDDEGAKSHFQVFVNPEIVEQHGEQIGTEGCLSFPGIYGNVKRYGFAKVKAYGLDGQEFELEGQGVIARTIQHEMDHLDGKLFTWRLSNVERLMAQSTLKKLQKMYRKKQQKAKRKAKRH